MADWLKNFEMQSGRIRLTQLIDQNERDFAAANEALLTQILNRLGQKTGTNFFELGQGKSAEQIFSDLRGILLKNFQPQLYETLEEFGVSRDVFNRQFIFGAMLSIVRGRENVSMLASMMKERGLIRGYSFLDGQYKLDTAEYGLINFMKVSDVYREPLAQTNIYAKEDLADNCHKYVEEFIKIYQTVEAVTCIETKLIAKKYYHSFALDRGYAVDVTNNLLVDAGTYGVLTDFQVLNRVNYRQFLETRGMSEPYDESGTLYDLLRMAVYRQVIEG